MWKRLVLSGLLFGLLLNFFSSPVAFLIFEINKQVQAHGNNLYQEVSLTLCETTCAIEEIIVIEQHYSTQAERPSRVSFNPLALYWENTEAFQLAALSKQHHLFWSHPSGQTSGYTPDILDPPKEV